MPPPFVKVVGLGGLGPPTSRLSGVRSNHLSYKPVRGSVSCDTSETDARTAEDHVKFVRTNFILSL